MHGPDRALCVPKGAARVAFQFVHMELFSRKGDAHGRSTDFVFAEAERRADACSHVSNPAPPEVVYGATIAQVRSMHKERVDQAKDIMKNGRTRSVRSSQHTVMTVIASHPVQVKEALVDPEKAQQVREWEEMTVRWLKAKYGSQLVSVIRHIDEQQCHLHGYILPENGMCKAALLHPGLSAKAAVMAAENEDAKVQNKLGDKAYKAAMREWQDDYHREVGACCGLARLGPQKRRLTRAEWHAEKQQALALMETLDRAAKVKHQGNTFIQDTKAKASMMMQEALHQQQIAQEALVEVERQRETVNRYTGFGGFLRAVLDGLKRSRITAKIRSEFMAEMNRLALKIKTSEQMLKTEQQKREQAERREGDALSAIRTLEIQRDVAKATAIRLKRKYEAPDPAARPSQGLGFGP